MRLTEAQRDLRWQMEVVSYRCLHAVEYFEGVTGKGDEFWKFTQNCYGEVACLLWCHLFNSRYNDPVHYCKLFGDDRLSGLGSRFTFGAVQQRLWLAAGLDADTYERFRAEVVTFRNKYVSHREYSVGSITFPPLDKVHAMCLDMRELLEETVRAELEANPGDNDLEDLLEYYACRQNAALLEWCREHVRLEGPNAA